MKETVCHISLWAGSDFTFLNPTDLPLQFTPVPSWILHPHAILVLTLHLDASPPLPHLMNRPFVPSRTCHRSTGHLPITSIPSLNLLACWTLDALAFPSPASQALSATRLLGITIHNPESPPWPHLISVEMVILNALHNIAHGLVSHTDFMLWKTMVSNSLCSHRESSSPECYLYAMETICALLCSTFPICL